MSENILSGTIHVLTDKENQIYTPMYPMTSKELVKGIENVDNISDINKHVDRANKDGLGNNINDTYYTKSLFETFSNDFFRSYKARNNIYRGKEITESWQSLHNRISSGDFSNLYIGDYKRFTLTTGEQVIMEIAGINHYRRHSYEDIKNHIDFISRNVLDTPVKFNDTATNNGTAEQPTVWLSSKLYDTLNNESTGIYSTLPNDLKPYIVEKVVLLERRYSQAGVVSNNTGWSWKSLGKLWIPSEVEVFGHSTWSERGFGTGGGRINMQYPIFQFSNKHYKKVGANGVDCEWWLLSASCHISSEFCTVSAGGTSFSSIANNQLVRTILCFSIY